VIVVDTPSLGMLSINAIAAANLVINAYRASHVRYFLQRAVLQLLEQLCDLYRDEISVQRLAILLTKVDTSTETLNNISLLSGSYGELILSNRMGLTKELQKSAVTRSVFMKSTSRGVRETPTTGR